MRDRNDIEELMHDVKTEVYDQKRKLALEEVRREFWIQLSIGEIADAISEFMPASEQEGFASCVFSGDREDDVNFLVRKCVGLWIEHQAEQEIQRRERKGDL